jgi:hypothetical protein
MADMFADSFGCHSAVCCHSSCAVRCSAIVQAEDLTVREAPTQLWEVAGALPLGAAVVAAPPLQEAVEENQGGRLSPDC